MINASNIPAINSFFNDVTDFFSNPTEVLGQIEDTLTEVADDAGDFIDAAAARIGVEIAREAAEAAKANADTAREALSFIEDIIADAEDFLGDLIDTVTFEVKLAAFQVEAELAKVFDPSNVPNLEAKIAQHIDQKDNFDRAVEDRAAQAAVVEVAEAELVAAEAALQAAIKELAKAEDQVETPPSLQDQIAEQEVKAAELDKVVDVLSDVVKQAEKATVEISRIEVEFEVAEFEERVAREIVQQAEQKFELAEDAVTSAQLALENNFTILDEAAKALGDLIDDVAFKIQIAGLEALKLLPFNDDAEIDVLIDGLIKNKAAFEEASKSAPSLEAQLERALKTLDDAGFDLATARDELDTAVETFETISSDRIEAIEDFREDFGGKTLEELEDTLLEAIRERDAVERELEALREQEAKEEDTVEQVDPDETVRGTKRDDDIETGSGNDTVKARNGDDTVDTGAGEDVLIGGRGNDVLTGGADADVFKFAKGHGEDTITDFEVELDTIDIGRGAKRLGQLDFEQDGDDTVVSFKNVEITLEDVNVADLLAADAFTF